MARIYYTEAQKRARDKWDAKNKEKMKYVRHRSRARSFIDIATEEDLQELEELIEQRKKQNI